MLATFSGLLAQTAPIEQTTTESRHVLHLIWNADPMVQLTIYILLAFSVVSWAIIIAKYRQLKQSKARSLQFFQLFWDSKNLNDISAKRGSRKGPAYEIFEAAQESAVNNRTVARKEALERDIRRAYSDEIEQLEYGVPFLATTASASPFIGLFGTVWGILNAFWKIGQTGASSLSIVGPHIAEALIATAIGLAAAIPAVIFYNMFVNQIRRNGKDLHDFTEVLIDRVEQENYGARA
ncbi:MAG: MotA/TolQ/ExbB proton channel family protein [Deltaproteobacteria bacterium]|nr:MotA/TolQ/ExbB proton channel family protein [Deltaproteobacteria bacterium]